METQEPRPDRSVLGQFLHFQVVHESPRDGKTRGSRQFLAMLGTSLDRCLGKPGFICWFSGSPKLDGAVLGQFLPFCHLRGGSDPENVRFLIGK